MRALIIADYWCAPEGHTAVLFKAGTEVAGIVAEWAVADGHAEPVDAKAPPENKATRPPRNKATRPPRNKG